MKPLDGIKIVELSTYVAAPSCGNMLAYLGAEVIKIEPIDGEVMRFAKKTPDDNATMEGLNLLKKSLAVDLKNREVREYIYKLVAQSDAFLTNVRKKSLESLGLDYQSLSKLRPSIVYGLFTGYGEKGPLADLPGYDMTAFFAKSGIYRDFVPPENPPVTYQNGFGDMCSGMAMTIGMLGGIIKAKRTGEGEYVTSSLPQVAAWVLLLPLINEQYGPTYDYPQKAKPKQNSGNFLCSDGRWIAYAAFVQRDLIKFCKTIGAEHLFEDERFKTYELRNQNSEEFYQEMQKYVMKFTSKELIEKLRENDVACEIHGHVCELPYDEQIVANEYLFQKKYGEHTVHIPKPPFRFGSFQDVDWAKDFRLGQDTAEILRNLGCPEEDIKRLAEQKAIII